MATTGPAKSLWREAFGDEEAPALYTPVRGQKSRFALLTSPQRFIKNLESTSKVQLYALAENCQLALKAAQDEYFHIERLIRHLEQKDPPTNPQALLDPERFEEEKEARLYGYKRMPRGMPYTRTRDGTEFIGFQEPFSQGGFVPTDAQYKRMKANAKDANNVDGWTPIERDGKKLIPRLPRSPPPRQRGFTVVLSRPSRKRRLAEQDFSDTDATAPLSDSDAFNTPSEQATRFLRRKVRPTRDQSERPVSHRSSPASSRQKKAVTNKTTPSLKSVPAVAQPSTQSTPAPPESSPKSSSNKRRRIDHQHDRPPFNTDSNYRPSPSHDDSEEKKWTDEALISSINADHSFLHPDPEIALSWKHVILNAPNPVRSYAMKRKWAWWKKGGMDKRPRKGGREGSTAEDESQDDDGPDTGGPRLKTEDVKAAGLINHEDDADHHGQPPLVKAADGHGSCEPKAPMARKQQRDGQFTFKLDAPSTPTSLRPKPPG